MTENRRRIERRNLDVHVNIVDMQTDNQVGALVNIHQEGMMVVGPTRLEVDRVYQLQLQPTGEASSVGDIQLGVDCVWSTGDDSSCWAGCRIIDCSPEALQQIEALNKEFAAAS